VGWIIPRAGFNLSGAEPTNQQVAGPGGRGAVSPAHADFFRNNRTDRGLKAAAQTNSAAAQLDSGIPLKSGIPIGRSPMPGTRDGVNMAL
jgi:hypothetical protein